MPSTVDPSVIETGPGKLHVDVASAAADLYANISSSLISTLSGVLTQPLAAPTTSTPTAGPASSVVLPLSQGPFYVGDSGGDSLLDLFHVVDSNTDAEIFNNVTNTYVTVSSISPAAIGSGFYNGNLTVNFNTPVPAGVSFKVYYGRRVTVGNLPTELASNPVIRRSPDRVRFPEIPRTGLAPTSVAAPINIVSGDYPDPYMAQWKALLRGTPAVLDTAFGGSSGFVNVGTKRNVFNDTEDSNPAAGQASAFLSVYEKNITGTGTVGSGNPLTRINAASTATLNPGGALPTTVELAVTDFFRTATTTAIRVGVDMLEVTFSNGVKECYVITGLDVTDARRATIGTLGGAAPTFTTASVTVRWIQTNFFVGGDNDSSGLTGFQFKGLFHAPSPNLTDAPNSENQQAPPFFASAREVLTTTTWGYQAFTWGHHYQNTATQGIGVAALGTRNITGELWADGSVNSRGRLIGMRSSRPQSIALSSSATFFWNPKDVNQLILDFTGASKIVLTLGLSTSYTATASANYSDEFTLVVLFSGITVDSAGESSQVVWPANFKFSGSDGDVSGPAGRVMIFRAVFINGTHWYLTRTDFGP